MNVLFQLAHPAHFYYFREIIKRLQNDGNKVFILIKSKDILEDLLQKAGMPYINIMHSVHKKNKLAYLWDLMIRDIYVLHYTIKYKIDILAGSTSEVAQIGWLLHRHSICIGEDDAAVVPAYIQTIKPFVETRLTPTSCDNGPIENKSVHYPGFLKLAYLHPNVFTPSVSICEKYKIDPIKPYFLIRFAKLNAHHDTGVQGISTEVAQHIIDLLSPHGQIYITSERELEPQFEQYRLHINPLDIHHVMAFATLYIGDSQSMAVEAAMLGVPSLRFNDFVGKKKIGVMEELEHTYGLTYGISSHEPDKLYSKIQELLGTGLKSEFQARRQRMLADKIDVTAFFTWFIENYPSSAKEAKNANEDFWKKFK